MLNEKERKAKPVKKANKIDSQVGEKLHALLHAVDHCREGIAISNMDGVLRYTNNAFAGMHGYKPDELLGKHLSIFHSPEQMPVVEAANRQVVSTGSFVGEIWHSRRDGTVFLSQMNSTLLMDKSDTPVGMIGTLRDITEKKKTEESLKKSVERYKALFQKAAEGIAVVDIETRKFRYVNPALCRMLGYTEEEMKKRRVHDIHPRENLEYVLSEFDVQAQGKKTLSLGIPCLRKDGTKIYADINTTNIMIDERECNVGFFTDITERERLKAELENYKEKILKAQRHAYISSMGTMVAYRINQPLTMVSILMGRVIEQLEQESCCPASLKNAREALAEVKKAASIILKFRQYFECPVLEAVGEKVNVSHAANSIIFMLSERAEQAKINISTKGLDELPEVEINETALEQIFLIIIQNAIEAADGRKQHKLDIIGKFTDVGIELQFSDDCRGIAPENLEKIFEPFFSTKTEDRGMGLGLDIIQQILTSCGGEIRAESQLGKGTTFYATLPVSNALKS